MASIESKAGLASADDQTVSVAGVYTVQDLGRYRIVSVGADGTKHQSNQLVYLELGDGSSVNLGARPDDERPTLTGKRVVATGKFKAAWPEPDPSGKAAQPKPEPTLIEISAVRAE